ncbi:MAG TPA: uracil-DNA glycosylase family protein [Rhizomicrobium sp.]|nr:uracil-DNA glycosylase family protein [Rhizomicrobium sp.]
MKSKGVRTVAAVGCCAEGHPPSFRLETLLKDIRSCRICEAHLSHGPRPVLHVSSTARLCVVSQAPGLRVHETGLSFNDRSGDRLREWMGISRANFYDESKLAIAAMAFCFPGYNSKGHDLPPRRECAAAWRSQLFDVLPKFPLTLLVGRYAQTWHLGAGAKETLTKTTQAWREYAPRCIPLPHPSWRNSGWLKKHPWYEDKLLPYLRRRVAETLSA